MQGLEYTEEHFRKDILDGFALLIKIVSVNYKQVSCKTSIYHNPVAIYRCKTQDTHCFETTESLSSHDSQLQNWDQQVSGSASQELLGKMHPESFPRK